MKIFIICSKRFYGKIEPIKKELEKNNHIVFLPNCYDNPDSEKLSKELGEEEHIKFKNKMFERSINVTKEVDAVLVLNFDKKTDDGVLKNYVGGATFLEMYDAYKENKEIYMYNDIPEGILYDEICGFAPILINQDLSKIKTQ